MCSFPPGSARVCPGAPAGETLFKFRVQSFEPFNLNFKISVWEYNWYEYYFLQKNPSKFANFINNSPSTLIVPFGTCSSGLQGSGACDCSDLFHERNALNKGKRMKYYG